MGHRIRDDGVSEARSSSSISSPPISPPHNQANPDTIHVARPSYPHPGFSGEGVVGKPAAVPALSSNVTAHVPNVNTSAHASSAANGGPPEKPKRQRKKKEVGPDGKPLPAEEKPKKPRKPREPKATAANGEKPTTSRSKKVKTEDKSTAPDASTALPRQSTITEMVGQYQQPTHSASAINAFPAPPHRPMEAMPQHAVMPPMQAIQNPIPRPFSSGQNYDPIRGSTRESVPPRPSNPPDLVHSAQASPHVNRASASPAIASLIDPPTAIKTSAAPTHSPQTSIQQPFTVPSQQSPPAHKPASAFAPPPQPPLPLQTSPSARPQQPARQSMDGAMDFELQDTIRVPPRDVPEIKAPSKSSSSAPTPKAARPTPPPAPKGTGSGLLSSSDLFGGPSNTSPAERKGVNIDIHIPLNPAGGNVINIAQEIIKKYGRDAINPRAAAHREQLMRIAMEQNKLADLTDDMSVDLTSEMEGDSNVEMGGMEDEKSATGLETDGKPVRKRRKKVEEYDKEDDFIDDTELAWQEQAAVAKDGFFVYSGPLVPEGETPQIESSAPTRGRGSRARSRGGRGASTGTTHASLAESKARDPTTSTRARTRGTRGTGVPRKPRMTKAGREKMEQEKLERERSAAASASSSTQQPVQSVPTHMMQPQHSYTTQPVGSTL
jgi:hypothetical protein